MPQSVNSIGDGIFDGCTSLHDVYCYAEVPPSTYNSYWTFSEAPVDKVTLHVPVSAVETYRQTDPWNSFGSIVALKDSDPKPTGIRNIEVLSNGKNSIYDLNGVRLSVPQKGVKIINGKKYVVNR